MSEYADRNEINLGEHYVKHVIAMTREGLHAKSAIAAELAFRDAEIERLRTENEELRRDRDRLQEFSNIVDGTNPLTLQKAEMLTEKGYRVAGFYLEKTGDDKCFIQHAHVTWVRDEEA